MMNKLSAYQKGEVETKHILSHAKTLSKSGVIDEEQYDHIKKSFNNILYSPSIVMKLFLFIVSLLGLITVSGPMGLIFSEGGIETIRVISVLYGIALLLFNDRLMIHDKKHYKSGVTEALSYSGMTFIFFGIMGIDQDFSNYPNLIFGLVGSTILCIRYHDNIAMLLSLFFCGWLLFELLNNSGGLATALLPFTFMAFAVGIFSVAFWIQKQTKSFIYDDSVILLKSVSLLLFYLSGNYFVVRELSIELMNIQLGEGEDIPYAFIFYAFTSIVPLVYLYLGIRSRSILFIRISLLCIALSIITLKIYFSLGMPIVTITIAGAVLIGLSLFFLNYLKETKNGFTREKLLQDKWSSQDFTAFVISQTAGGTPNPPSENTPFKGGEFGGGGAGGNWQ